jgi:hypothetical protein
MKNGLMVYKSYVGLFNIGDYIQSLAAKQFIQSDIVYLNRERLDEYIGSPIKLSMNGWFLLEPQHWPPSDNINPLFVSFHLNSDAYELLENKSSVEYLKKNEPIGCRDLTTMNLLIDKGIKAYFTGCLTLTLGEKYKNKKCNDVIYFVDPYFDFKKNIISFLNYFSVAILNYGKISRISKLKYGALSIKTILKTAAFFKDYRMIFDTEVLESAIYVNQEIYVNGFSTEEEKFNFAEDLLNKYAMAKYIVTSRIHCALPCLSMETPVLYVENVNQALTSYCRLNGLRELFHIIKYDKGKMKSPFDNLKNKKINSNLLFTNKQDYLTLKDKLIIKCNDFFNS